MATDAKINAGKNGFEAYRAMMQDVDPVLENNEFSLA